MENSILKQYFKEYLKLYPSFASFLGDRRKDGEFENILAKSHNIRYGRMMKKYEKILDTYKGKRDIDYKILRWIVNDNNESNKYPLNLIPMTSFENWIIDFTFINKTLYPLKTFKDLENLFNRHLSFRMYVESAQRKFQVGLNQKHTMPDIICMKMLDSLAEFVKQKKYIIEIPWTIEKEHPKTSKKFINFLRGPYISTINHFIKFMKNVYLPRCRTSIGLCGLPRGKNMYKYLVKSQTTLNISPEIVHSIGKREVKRIENEINSIKILLGYSDTISLHEFYQKMTENTRNYYKNEDRIIKEYKEIQKQIDTDVIPNNFHINVNSYSIKRVPRSLEKTSAGAFYYPGNQVRKGTFYINLRDFKENAKYNMQALTLHEGKPGHHYQFQYMIETNVPLHRQYAIANNAFVEGWALYAESLGNYKNNPYDYFGKLTYEMFRAVRLVVDTGIHYYNWSYNEAVDYMKRHLALSHTEIETEVQRYICIPGQALCYKIGERKIVNLKQRYLKKFGHMKDAIKNFHKLLLEDGIIPLSLLESKINTIILHKNV